ncbi:MAG: hypothetical protein C0456_20600 [Hyphomonas sp.]|uniref:hypothetical protein n=1 Tax=Hyphomonas sp. TaxID=87 RepID=UPI001DEE5427|nr:hypothetical protein [Hyphomonas sp.]MBA4228997.1 hypothetical protein [Hyphomonas sp.]
MRTAGYGFVFLGLAQAILLQFTGRDNVTLLASFGLCMLVGTVLLAANAIARFLRGTLQLRPFNALKLFPVLFIVMFALTFGLRLIMPSNFSATETVWLVAIMAVFFSIYATIYRKRA